MSYARKTKCAIARCPHCSWRKALFGVDNRELGERVVQETLAHLREASPRKRGAK